MLWRSILACLGLFAILASAQESPDSETSSDSQPTETATEQSSDSDEGFVPTKEVPADDEITFPVDI